MFCTLVGAKYFGIDYVIHPIIQDLSVVALTATLIKSLG
jgi:hypothetical protein